LEIHLVVMKQFVTLLAVVGSSLAAPAADPQLVQVAAPYINQGAASGPLTPAVGDLVATPKGYKSLALEGFSEDLNQDGFVDPIAQAVVPVVHHAPVVAAPAVAAYSVPRVGPPAVAAYHAVAPVAATKVVAAPAPAVAAYSVPAATTKLVAAPAVAAYHAAPVAYATAPVVQHVGYNVHHTVQHVPQVAVQKHVTHHVTQHVINHAPVVGAAFTGLLPVGVAPVAAAEAIPDVPGAAPAVEEA